MNKEGFEGSKSTQMISRKFLCERRAPSVISKAGPMPPALQTEFDNGLNMGTDEGVNLALLVLDRWRFASLDREEQLYELAWNRANYELAEQEGDFYPHVHPDDLADLVFPEEANRQEWLQQISPYPPNGFYSLVPIKVTRE